MGASRKPTGDDPTFGRLVFDDIKKEGLRQDYFREFQQLYQFYVDDHLDAERRSKLESMGRVPRAFALLGGIVSTMLRKLSATRRLLLIVGLLLALWPPWTLSTKWFDLGTDLRPAGAVLLLIVIMLELKDKLLARDEIAIARQVQIQLLPDRHPTVPGWSVWSCSRPANDVGGDLVDYLELDGFRHGVVLGDVAGKGLGAALLTAKLQATLRALIPDSPSLDDLGARVNDIFYRDGLDNRYATLFFAELEHDSGAVRYLNAGHNPAFVIRVDRIEKLSASSFPLGMLDSASYEEGSLELEPGDLLVAYSDGLTEATNGCGEEFGEERLERLLPELRTLSPEEIGERMLAEVDVFLDGARLTDDLSIAVVAREQR